MILMPKNSKKIHKFLIKTSYPRGEIIAFGLDYIVEVKFGSHDGVIAFNVGQSVITSACLCSM